MAHFAELDNNNTVLRVLVIPDEQEHRGHDFLANDLGLGGTWIQTSYNNRIRKQFAGIGFTYNQAADVFVAPQPAPWFTLNENFDWECPDHINPQTGEQLTEEQILLRRLDATAAYPLMPQE